MAHPLDPHTDAAVDAVLTAVKNEYDFGGWLGSVLAYAVSELGSTRALIAGRPGSWEADLVNRLVGGTVGWDDDPEMLSMFTREPKGDEEATPGADATQAAERLVGAMRDAAEHRHVVPQRPWTQGPGVIAFDVDLVDSDDLPTHATARVVVTFPHGGERA